MFEYNVLWHSRTRFPKPIVCIYIYKKHDSINSQKSSYKQLGKQKSIDTILLIQSRYYYLLFNLHEFNS